MRSSIRTMALGLLACLLASRAALRAQAQQEVQVGEYGAVPDDGQNDLLAIRAAILALPSSDSALVFEPGVYDLYPSDPSMPTGFWPPAALATITAPLMRSMFYIQSKANLTIEGNGAVLLAHDFDPTRPHNASYYNLFEINGCTGLVVRGLTVNMSRLPYSMGTVTEIRGYPNAVNTRYFKVDIDPYFLAPSPPGTNPLQAMTIDMLTHYELGFAHPNGRVFFEWQSFPMDPSGPEFYVSAVSSGTIHEIKGNVSQWPAANAGYSLMQNLPDPGNPQVSDYGKLKVGDQVVFVHQFHGYIAFGLAACNDALVSNVTVHHWAGQALNATRQDDLTVSGLLVLPDPAHGWPMSTTSDAIHLRDVGGVLTIEGCHLQGMADDGITYYTHFRKVGCVHTTTNSLEITDSCVPPCAFQAGHVFEIYDANLLPLGTRTLQQELQTSCPGAKHHLQFTSALPSGAIQYVSNLSWFPTSATITGSTVAANRGIGMRPRRNSLVDGCTLTQTTSAGILVGPEVVYFNEGPGAANVTIQNTSLSGVNEGWGMTERSEGAITVVTEIPGTGGNKVYGPMGGVANVLVKTCTIENTGGAVASVRSCDTFTIDQCSFGSASYLWTLFPTTPAKYAAESLLFFTEVKNVTITSNSVLQGASIQKGDRTLNPMYGFYTKTGNTGF